VVGDAQRDVQLRHQVARTLQQTLHLPQVYFFLKLKYKIIVYWGLVASTDKGDK
jgi:hypothetical protein